MDNLPKRVALVYDWVDKWGGAEQVLLALHEIFPAAPLYTLVYQPDKAAWAKVFPGFLPVLSKRFPLPNSGMRDFRLWLCFLWPVKLWI